MATIKKEDQTVMMNTRNTTKVICFFTLCLFILYDFIQLHLPNTLLTTLVAHADISVQQIRWSASIYFWADLTFILLAGLFLDSYAPNKIIFLFLCQSIMGILIFAYWLEVNSMVIWRLTAGILAAFSISGALKLSTIWFSKKYLGLLTGIIGVMAMLGGAIAQTPMLSLLKEAGLFMTLLINALFGLLITILLLTYKTEEPNKSKFSPAKYVAKMKEFTLIVSSYNNWIAAFLCAVLNIPFFILAALWGNVFLMNHFEISEQAASATILMLFLGYIVGAPIVGYLHDRLEQKETIILFSSFLYALCFIVFLMLPSTASIYLKGLFFIIGFLASMQCLLYTIVTKNNDKNPAMAISLISFVSVGSGAILQPLFGSYLSGKEGFYFLVLIGLITFFLALLFAKQTSRERSDFIMFLQPDRN